MGIWYATRGQVTRSLEIANGAYSNSLIDAKIDAASRNIEGFLHRSHFYPELRTILMDWPSLSNPQTWEVDLGDQYMISLAQVLSGGTDITANCILRRSDDLAKPPYNLLQIDLSSNATFSAGSTWQRSLSIRGLFGQNDTATDLAGGLLSGGINSSVTTINITPSSGIYTADVGSLILIDDERMVLVARRMQSSGQIISAEMSDTMSAVIATSSGAANFAVGEVIAIDAERMLIEDIVGTSIVVQRAYDGTVLATHANGSTLYAERQFTVRRGALGSTAASHSDAEPVYVHEYPADLNELCVAESVVLLEQNSSAYARTVGSGASSREAGAGKGLEDMRNRAWESLARKGRSAAI